MTVLVTGASGMVGRALLPVLREAGLEVRGADGRTGPRLDEANADWRPALAGCAVVVHLAARVHVMQATPGAEAAFEATNVHGTLRLASQAVEAGVRRVVFVSTVKVHGETGHVTAATPYAPGDAYARSKHHAELALQALAARTGLELVIVRPPLVYGPGARANVAALLNAVRRGWPLPLASIRNQRSLIGTANLADALSAAVRTPGAAGAAVAVCDGAPISTPDLIRTFAQALGVSARLWPVPVPVLRAVAALTQRREALDRLVGSLTIDPRPSAVALGWQPQHSMAVQVAQMVAATHPGTAAGARQ